VEEVEGIHDEDGKMDAAIHEGGSSYTLDE